MPRKIIQPNEEIKRKKFVMGMKDPLTGEYPHSGYANVLFKWDGVSYKTVKVKKLKRVHRHPKQTPKPGAAANRKAKEDEFREKVRQAKAKAKAARQVSNNFFYLVVLLILSEGAVETYTGGRGKKRGVEGGATHRGDVYDEMDESLL